LVELFVCSQKASSSVTQRGRRNGRCSSIEEVRACLWETQDYMMILQHTKKLDRCGCLDRYRDRRRLNPTNIEMLPFVVTAIGVNRTLACRERAEADDDDPNVNFDDKRNKKRMRIEFCVFSNAFMSCTSLLRGCMRLLICLCQMISYIPARLSRAVVRRAAKIALDHRYGPVAHPNRAYRL